jgi:hypothetical protein
MLRTSGTGTVVLSSYGAVFDRTLAAGERYKVDTGHLVAFSKGIGYSVQRIGGLKSTFFSGEGLVVELTGPGQEENVDHRRLARDDQGTGQVRKREHRCQPLNHQPAHYCSTYTRIPLLTIMEA